MFRTIKSFFGGIGHVIQESYCALGERVAEQFEGLSDAIAEQRYRAAQTGGKPAQPPLDVDFRVVGMARLDHSSNGHSNPN